MKKKIVSALLLSAMIAGMCAVSPISAADEEKVTLGTPKKEPVTLSADANTAPKDLLKDVEKDNDKWYFGAMKTTYNMSLIKGKRLPSGEDAWLPNEKTTRAELVTIIRRYAGVSDEEIKGMGDKVAFNDTKSHWAEDEIAWAAENGIVKGYNDGEYFDPDKSVTRAEISAILVRAADKIDSIDISKQESLVDSFVDVDGHWASSEKEDNVLDKAREHGLITGKATDSEGNNYFYPDENATRAEVATMLTRFDMDPMYYVVSNLGEYLATRDTRPLLQFSDSQEFSIETMNNIILPQVGLDPDKYTVVLPEYQMHKMTDDEENDYKKPIIGEDGKQKVDEKGELLFSNEDCGCGSFYGDCGFSGAGGGTDPKQNQMVLEPWFAIKNTNGTEDTSDDVVTQYVRYEWTVIKMDSSAENDQVYVGLKNLNDTVTAYARKLDKNSILNLVIQAAAVESDGVNEALSANGKTTPAGYAYSVKVSDEQIEAALNAFNALKNNGEKTGELTLDVTVQNKATFKPAVTCSISMIIEMDKSSLIPWVG